MTAVKKYIYADNSATTRLDPEVLAAMLPFLGDSYGNPSSLHRLGRASREAIVSARAQIAAYLGAQPKEIFFTSGGTESNNWALKGLAEIRSGKRHIITSPLEHHTVLRSCQHLQATGYVLSYVQPDGQGGVDASELCSLIRPDTAFISLMLANNEIGTLSDVSALSAMAKGSGVPFHTDAVQAVGHIPIDVHRLGVDLLSGSAHKFNGPKGVGFLYKRTGVELAAWIDGGHQEQGLRAGTENVAGIVGMAAALRNSHERMAAVTAKLRRMEETFRLAIGSDISSAVFNGDNVHRLPGHINLSLSGISAETLLHLLDLRGIMVSTGAACNSESTVVSHVLRGIGLSETLARGTLRVSFGYDNREDDAISVAQAIITLYRKIQPK